MKIYNDFTLYFRVVPSGKRVVYYYAYDANGKRLKLKDPEFKRLYEEETRLLELGIAIAKAREKSGLSQKELSQKSRVTQQQLSKIENGVNCNVLTLVRVSTALGLNLSVTA